MSPTKKQERTQVLWKGKQFLSTSGIRYCYYCYNLLIWLSYWTLVYVYINNINLHHNTELKTRRHAIGQNGDPTKNQVQTQVFWKNKQFLVHPTFMLQTFHFPALFLTHHLVLG